METVTKLCPNCGEENPAKAKFCLECATPLALVSPSEERRYVTVLFADLSGFTAYSEKVDMENVKALAHEAAGRLGEIVERYGGVVDKVIGDAVMAVFGAPISHEDDPERAVRAALDMQTYVTQNSDRFAKLPLTIGINTGEAMYAPVGPGTDYTVIGDTVNTASRIQGAATKGEILVGQATFEATQDVVDYEEVPPIKAKNKAEPVVVWKAISVKGVKASRIATRTSWVGRDAEYERLWELWQRAKENTSPHLAYLLGNPGIGKSRLISEFLRGAGGSCSAYRGRCLSYGEGITYWPVIEIIKDAAGIVHDDESEVVSAKLGTFLEHLGSEDVDELRTMAVALANLVAAPTTPRGTYEATKISQAELHWGLRRVFHLLATREPLVLIFEDLHWAEPTLLEFVEFLTDGEGPLLILGTARPELKESFPAAVEAKSHKRVIELEALTDEQSRELIRGVAGEEIDPGQIDDLLKAAGGNPLFLEETLRMLADIAMTKEPGTESATRISVPTNLKTLIGSRLDRLNVLEKRIAQHASVVGQTFWKRAVAYLSEQDTELDLGLNSLEVRDLIREQEDSMIAGESEWSFKHALIRDVAYERLPKNDRARLHVRSGEWIAALPGNQDDFVEIVAYHLEQACRLASEMKRSSITPPLLQAVQALTRAAEKAEGREGTREANGFYSRAIELLGDRLPETASELRMRRSRTITALGDWKAGFDQLSEVADAASRLGRKDLVGKSLLGLATIEMIQGRMTEAQTRLEEAGRLALETGDESVAVRTTYELARLSLMSGSSTNAIEDIEDALLRAEKLGDRGLQIEGHMRLGNHFLNSGELIKAEEQYERCAQLSRQEGTLRYEAGATQFLGLTKFYRGDIEQAERLTIQSSEWFERTASRYLQLQNSRALARFALAREDLTLAEERLAAAISQSEDISGWLVVDLYRFLAETLAWQGRVNEAREAAEQARAHLPSQENLYATAAALMAEAFAAMASGDERRMRECFEEALPMIEKQGYAIDLGDAHIAFGRALAKFEDHAGAAAQLTKAREIFAPMGALGPLLEIDRELVVTTPGT